MGATQGADRQRPRAAGKKERRVEQRSSPPSADPQDRERPSLHANTRISGLSCLKSLEFSVTFEFTGCAI